MERNDDLLCYSDSTFPTCWINDMITAVGDFLFFDELVDLLFGIVTGEG
jgi:hypothetical protein